MISHRDAADAMSAARNALLVLEWISSRAQDDQLVCTTAQVQDSVVASALRRAPSLPGIKDAILRALKDEAEAALVAAEKALGEYAQARDATSLLHPPGFSGIDGA